MKKTTLVIQRKNADPITIDAYQVTGTPYYVHRSIVPGRNGEWDYNTDYWDISHACGLRVIPYYHKRINAERHARQLAAAYNGTAMPTPDMPEYAALGKTARKLYQLQKEVNA